VWLAGALAASLAIGAAALWRRDAGAMKLDAELVAIAPFHVAGADSSLAYAREGMVDLLTAALSTTSTLRPLDARATSVAMRGDMGDAETMSRLIGTSRRLHASRLVTGAVVGTTDHLTLTATLTDTRTGRPVASATVTGRADSLAALADGLAVQLLTATLHEPLSGRISLARRDPVAVRAYLAGQESYRAGRYRDAVARYSAALERDSSFVQAIMGLVFAAGWSGDSFARHRATDLAWSLRGNLSPADRAHLAAITGPAYPSRPSAAVRLAAWERAAAVAGDRPEVWFALGDDYFHKGYLLGAERPFERADAAFSRALELDSTFVPPLEHRLQLAFYAQDAARSRELMRRYRRAAPMTAENAFIYWRAALAEDDSASLGIIRSALDTMDASSLRWMAVTAQFDGVGLDDARRALDVAARRAATDDERAGVLLGMHSLAANRGRMSEALASLRRLGSVTSHSNDAWRLIVLDAIYAGGDQVAAAEAIRHLAALDARGAADGDSAAALATSCVVAQWRLAHEDSTAVAAIAFRLARAATRPGDATSATDDAKACSLLLGASLQARRGDANARETVRVLDDYLQEGPYLLHMGSYAPLALARLYEAAGDRPAALAAVRRRGYFGRWPQQLRAHLDMEARLATSLGDRGGAREATARLRALQR
jgi:tetratricopeptide (TPR) repeat protein